TIRAFRVHPTIDSFCGPRHDDSLLPSGLHNVSRSSGRRSSRNQQFRQPPTLVRTDSAMSMTVTDSLSLARFVTYVLIFASSSSIVLTGIFGLNISFRLSCHPLLRDPWLVNGYCILFLLRVSRALMLSIPCLQQFMK